MPKRYHQSSKDRMHESHSMELRMKAMHSDSDYSDYDSRRRRERRDGAMIHEDHNAPANLPQQVMLKYWENNQGYLPEVIDDTIRSVDNQIRSDDHERSKGMKPHKF